jgi:uncharacterized protein YwlG (UPF0340 family)
LSRDRRGEVAAEDHITCPGAAAIRVGKGCADHEVIKTIAVDVAGGADGAAAAVSRRDPVEAKTVSAIKGVEIDARGKAARLAENDITRPGIVAIQVGTGSIDYEVIKTIAVDIAGSADGAAAQVERRAPFEAEAVRAIEGVEIGGRRNESPRVSWRLFSLSQAASASGRASSR